MTAAQDHYQAIAAGFSARLHAVGADDWSAPSPSPGWPARDVAAPVVGTHARVRSNVDGSPVVEAGADEDVVGAWDLETAAVSAALADPATAGRTVGGRFGEMAFEDLVDRMLCADTLVHTWDLARAVGGDERLDPVSVEHVFAFLTAAGDRIRVPGGFGPAVEPPPGADEATVLLAFAGRAV